MGRLAPRRRSLRVALIVAGSLLLLAVAAFLWVGIRATLAKDALDRARSLSSQLQASVLDDPSSAPRLADDISRETSTAHSLTDDWVWRFAEYTPWLGRNLTVVRELAASIDAIADGALPPLAEVASTLDISRLKPIGGRLDLTPIVSAEGAVATADDLLSAEARKVHAIDSGGTVAQVAQAHRELTSLLDSTSATLSELRKVVEVLPGMLGAEGPRQYLLMFQNNAEARSLGGNPAAMLLMTVDDGAMAIQQQASSGDFPNGGEPPIALDPNIYEVYYPDFPRYVQDIATRPDFPTAARLAQGFWSRQFGTTVSGVVSLDPVALARILDATGPVPLSTGDVLTSDNAVRLLMSDVYARYPNPPDQDAFFAAAAASIFDAVTEGSLDPRKLFDALTAAAAQGRFLAWSDRPDEQAVISTSAVAGILPTDNSAATTLGVYFNDTSSSKIDYWVDTAATVTSTVCSEPEAPIFSVTYTISSLITLEQAEALPYYVTSYVFGPGEFATEVYVVGPPGSTMLDWKVDTPAISNQLFSSGQDLGRPVVRIANNIATGESTSVTVRFLGGADDYGPVAVRTTPMVNPTIVDVSRATCD